MIIGEGGGRGSNIGVCISGICDRWIFGNPTIMNADGDVIETSTIGNFYLYTGREYDLKTGLYFYRARYYDPRIGRFLSEDPDKFWSGINFYLYGKNNPLTFIDPSGRKPYKKMSLPKLCLDLINSIINNINKRRRNDMKKELDKLRNWFDKEREQARKGYENAIDNCMQLRCPEDYQKCIKNATDEYNRYLHWLGQEYLENSNRIRKHYESEIMDEIERTLDNANNICNLKFDL